MMNTYIVADHGVVLGWEGGIWVRLLEGQKQGWEPCVKQGRKGRKAEDDGEESGDAHIEFVKIDG
jgi:hypothetical protein